MILKFFVTLLFTSIFFVLASSSVSLAEEGGDDGIFLCSTTSGHGPELGGQGRTLTIVADTDLSGYSLYRDFNVNQEVVNYDKKFQWKATGIESEHLKITVSDFKEHEQNISTFRGDVVITLEPSDAIRFHKNSIEHATRCWGFTDRIRQFKGF